MLDYALLNGFIRPDYLSMNYKDINCVFRLFRTLGGRTLIWTVKDISIEHDLHNLVDGVIFENYLPSIKNNL